MVTMEIQAMAEKRALKQEIYGKKVCKIMKGSFHIISDGSCDLPPELAQEKDITVVPFYV